jgi:large subunit ribosomal protein L27
MAHTKAGGSTKLGRDSRAKRLGVKIHDGLPVSVGQIIVRQRGTKYYPGENVRRAGDDTLYAAASGTVKFSTKLRTHFDRSRSKVTVVGVVAEAPKA